MNKLEQAASLLENNWCRSNLAASDGKFCSLGAILATYGWTRGMILNKGQVEAYDFAKVLPETQALADEIMESGVEYHKSNSISPEIVVYEWNDVQRDVNDVLEMFKHAARRL